MKVNALNVNFGKKLIATCTVKDQDRNKHSASLYEYNTRDLNDLDEIHNSPDTVSVKRAFIRDSIRVKPTTLESKYYALCDDETGEITSCAKLTRRFATRGKHIGYYTSIDELEGNKKYQDSLTAMIGFIAQRAQDTYCDNIMSAFRTYELPELKEQKFKKTEFDTWLMRRRGFDCAVHRAETRNQLEIIG